MFSVFFRPILPFSFWFILARQSRDLVIAFLLIVKSYLLELLLLIFYFVSALNLSHVAIGHWHPFVRQCYPRRTVFPFVEQCLLANV